MGGEWRPLADQLELQREAFGVDPNDLTPDEQSEYVRWNVLAATDELHEALHEVEWKPWSKKSGMKDKEAVKEECVDVLHFVFNILIAAGCNDDELRERFGRKQQVNSDRQKPGGRYGE